MIYFILILIFFLIIYRRERFVNYKNLDKVNNNEIPCPITV